jgi:hypothetical protein
MQNDEANILPTEFIDLSRINSINLEGRGGKEKHFSVLLPRWKRSSSPLYDYELEHKGRLLKLEIKKQANVQWFDSGKYYLLNEVDREIILLLVNHLKGRINLIAAICLGNFIDLLVSEQQYHALGWSEEVMKIAADLKKKYPSLQFKVKAQIGSIIRDHRCHFQMLFERF